MQEQLNPVQARMQAILELGKQQQMQRDLAILNTADGAQRFLKEEDAKVLDAILDRITVAYNKDILTGYKFEDNVEKMVAIVSALQYAKREVRELLEPSGNNIDLYQLFDRDLRDMVTSSYGSLPYFREPTLLEMPDGTFRTLDVEACERAEAGTPANIKRLNVALNIISSKLGLYANYQVSEEQESVAWNRAVAKLNTVKQLQLLQGALMK